MNTTRQDAWNKDEDLILAETVLRYIREGKTQLEAFKEVAERLSRTSAACGFRWNASIRKQYQSAIQLARQERKQGNTSESWVPKMNEGEHYHGDSLEQAILLLKKIKVSTDDKDKITNKERKRIIQQLKDENQSLKKQLSRYHEAWTEMGKLWGWIEQEKVKM